MVTRAFLRLPVQMKQKVWEKVSLFITWQYKEVQSSKKILNRDTIDIFIAPFLQIAAIHIPFATKNITKGIRKTVGRTLCGYYQSMA